MHNSIKTGNKCLIMNMKTCSFCNEKLKVVIVLLSVNLLYSAVSVSVKYTSIQQIFSMQYYMCISIVFALLGTYAVLWQQILKRMDISLAYMFKATTIIYTLLFSVLLFNESITFWNIVGALIIVVGIVLYVKA